MPTVNFFVVLKAHAAKFVAEFDEVNSEPIHQIQALFHSKNSQIWQKFWQTLCHQRATSGASKIKKTSENPTKPLGRRPYPHDQNDNQTFWVGFKLLSWNLTYVQINFF